MKNNCFDIGTIQAFIDSELASSASEKVVKHIAICDDCARLLAETEEESAFAFSALDAELNPLVPTERLRTKVFASIHEIESKRDQGLWNRIVGGLGLSGGFGFAKPGLVAFASLALFASGFAYIAGIYSGRQADNVAENDNSVSEDLTRTDDVVTPTRIASNDQNSLAEAPEIEDESETPIVIKAVDEPKPRRTVSRKPRIQNAIYVKPTERPKPIRTRARATVYGEESYIQTIATLDKSVDQRKDIVLRPKERVQFEKNMALVNHAIKRMKREVRKNPKNKAAREILKASYQNKIDLLNSVSDQDEMVAGL